MCFNENCLKMIEKAFHLNVKNYFLLDIFTFCPLEKYIKVNFKIHDVTDWTTNNHDTYIA